MLNKDSRSYAASVEYRIRPNGDKIAILSASDFEALIEIEKAARLLIEEGGWAEEAFDEMSDLAALRDALKGK